jgi:hypothetical protein
MVNYSNSKVYKIVDNTNNNIYIGSTTQELSKRLATHRAVYRRNINGKSRNTLTSFKILKNDDYQIILLENVVCNNKNHLLQRERHYIDRLDCVNKQKPLRTKAEWDIDNPDYYKNWRLNNKENYLEYFQKYFQDNKFKNN